MCQQAGEHEVRGTMGYSAGKGILSGYMKGVFSSLNASVPRQHAIHLLAACPELFPPFPGKQGKLVTAR